MIVDSILEFTRSSCHKPENVFSESFFEEHLMLVAKYADALCDILGGNKEIVRISSYLHDISAVLDFKTLPTHNVDSAQIAESLLKEYEYQGEKIQMVKQAIIKHPSPLKTDQGTIEEICVSNADAIAQIINPTYWFYFLYKVKSTSFEDGKTWYMTKIKSNWEGLIEPAKQLINDKYEYVSKALNNPF